MGSIDRACISGFLCRLCSEMHRIVIHIYGEQGQKHGLVEKINGYLPITISPTDPLPKTICGGCLKRVQQHYELLQRVARLREHNIELKEVSMKSELCHQSLLVVISMKLNLFVYFGNESINIMLALKHFSLCSLPDLVR